MLHRLSPSFFCHPMFFHPIFSPRNLAYNVGPGFNGWKLAVGSAQLLAAIVDADTECTHATVHRGGGGVLAVTVVVGIDV